MSVTRQPGPAAEPALDPASLFKQLAGRRGLILAISGGPDSTALMVLMSLWRERPPTLVVSVDHGVRPEAAAEARMVAENAARLDLPWRIMTPSDRQPAGNLQDWARRARYRCLVAAATEAGFDTIVTAHHRDDQAETFLLRLARGSGVYGLAAMAEESSVEGVLLARPLLGVSRTDLQQVAAESGLSVVTDPSNSDLRFDRVRMRGLMPTLAKHGLTAARLSATAEHLRRAATALDHYAGTFLREYFEADPFGVVSGPAEAFATAPEEVGLRALALILKAVGGADYTPRLDGLEALHTAILTADRDGQVKRTLSGVVISVVAQTLTARREWGRDGLHDLPAPAGATLLWDGRFEVEVPPRQGGLSIGALARSRRRFRSAATERSVIQTLPGLFQDGTLVAVPTSIFAADEGGPLDRLAVECVVGRRLGISAGEASAPR